MKPTSELIQAVRRIITQSRASAIRSVDTARVLMYWKIGQVIFEEEQQGEDRAAYGTFLIKSLSKELKPQFGSGFSVRQLERYRQFYRTFPIASALRTQFNWTHYKALISIDNDDKREFYIEEASKNNWSARQLERQVNSQLFERLLLSNDVASVLKMARAEKKPEDAREIIKDPMVLEFLGLRRESAYYEKDLESAIITGQLQMYVNYFDRNEKEDFENLTIGILLCADKNDAMVKISLPEHNKTIIASKYQLYLPTEQQLIDEVKKEIEKLDLPNAGS